MRQCSTSLQLSLLKTAVCAGKADQQDRADHWLNPTIPTQLAWSSSCKLAEVQVLPFNQVMDQAAHDLK